MDLTKDAEKDRTKDAEMGHIKGADQKFLTAASATGITTKERVTHQLVTHMAVPDRHQTIGPETAINAKLTGTL